MRFFRSLCTLGTVVALSWTLFVLPKALAEAPEPYAPQTPQTPKAPDTPYPTTPPATPETPSTTPSPEQAQASPSESFAQAPSAGTEAGGTADPTMMGDFLGYSVLTTFTTNMTVTVPQLTTTLVTITTQQTTPSGIVYSVNGVLVTIAPSQPPPPPQISTLVSTVFTTTNVTTTVAVVTTINVQTIQSGHRATIRALEIAHGAFKIADNESPQPQDRVFINYNYFNGARGTNLTDFATTFTDVHRETFGFEKTFLDGNASIGLRAPVLQTEGDGSFRQNDFGDLSVVLKYALINDRQTGDCLSGGLVVTCPTGPAINTPDGDINSVLLQPWCGFVYNMDGFYAQGFSSCVVPIDSRDVTILFNDLGVGYRIGRADCDRLITAIIPIGEVHVNTPLNHRESTGIVEAFDEVDLTGGTILELNKRSTLSIGVVSPVTGPRPFDVEAIAQFNLYF